MQFVRFTKVVSFEKHFTIPTYMLDQSFSQCLLSAFFFNLLKQSILLNTLMDDEASSACTYVHANLVFDL